MLTAASAENSLPPPTSLRSVSSLAVSLDPRFVLWVVGWWYATSAL
jgi:hypothetical protein